jgi:hypothetical protein
MKEKLYQYDNREMCMYLSDWKDELNDMDKSIDYIELSLMKPDIGSDDYWCNKEFPSLSFQGVALLNGGGGSKLKGLATSCST